MKITMQGKAGSIGKISMCSTKNKINKNKIAAVRFNCSNHGWYYLVLSRNKCREYSYSKLASTDALVPWICHLPP